MSPSSTYTVEMLVTQPCPTLCGPVDCIPQGSSIHWFCRQEYWSGFPFRSPGNLSAPGIEPMSLALRADSLSSEPARKPLQVYSGVLLCSGSQGFSTFGLLLLLFRIFSVFCLIEGLPLVPGRWYKAMKQTWWWFLGIPGDCDFMFKTFPAPCLDVHWNSIPAWFLQLSTSAHFPSLSF